MRLHFDIMLAAAVTAAAAGLAVSGSPATTPVAAAEVRFTNNTPETATLNANGEALFTEVAPKETSEWTAVADSAVTFTLVIPGEGKPPATATKVIVDGERYTVTGTVDAGGDPSLSIKVEPPMPKPDSTSH
jgi:hypothetical protein